VLWLLAWVPQRTKRSTRGGHVLTPNMTHGGIMSPYVVMRMPISMWLCNLETGTPMKWGVLDVPKNNWVAGPYTSQERAEEARLGIEEWEHA
jgi:hypothetical protein